MERWQEIADLLKAKTWDITEEWLGESKNDLTVDDNLLSMPDEEIISDVPTLIGGIANAVQDPVYLEDFQPGGHVHTVALEFGRSRQNNGYQIEKVLADYSLLRRKIWSCCKHRLNLNPDRFFELEHRVNLAIDRITEASMQSFHQNNSVELTELAQKDKLTGFFHLKALKQMLDDEVTRARRYHRPLSLAIIDIDKFRQFNQDYGRSAGDQLLQDVARNIFQIVRATDRSARLSGDEFGVLMPETDIKKAKAVVERVRRNIKLETIRHETMATLSIGIAAYPANVSNKDELLREGRLALTRAQEEGGDFVWISTKESS